MHSVALFNIKFIDLIT